MDEEYHIVYLVHIIFVVNKRRDVCTGHEGERGWYVE
jgi:hypothetical protein